MKKFLLFTGASILLFCSVGCASLEKQATLVNWKNVEKVTAENDAFWDASDKPDSVKNVKKERNDRARKLAKQMAESAGNKQETFIPDPADGE